MQSVLNTKPSALGHATSLVYQIAPHLKLVLDGEERAFLVGEQQRIPVTGAVNISLFKWLAVGLSQRELLERTGPQLAQWLYALERHVADGHVMAGRTLDELQDPRTAWLASVGRSPLAACAHRVAIEFVGDHHDSALRQTILKAFHASGLTIDHDSAVKVLVVNDYRDPQLGRALKQLSRQPGQCHIPFRPRGHTVWLGPVIGAAYACWDCLMHRLLDNNPIETWLARAADDGEPFHAVAPCLPETLTVAATFAASQLWRAPIWTRNTTEPTAAEPSSALPLMTFDLASFQIAEHAAPRRPQCHACGDATLMSKKGQRAVELQPRAKVFISDGGHRVMPPDETFDRLKHLISPVTGVVSKLGIIHARSDAVRKVYGATHFITPARGDPLEADRFEMVSVGKGKTSAQAQTSALCEAIERKCARYQGDEPSVLARFADLGGDAIAPNELLLFSQQQYAQRASTQSAQRISSPRSQQVPRPFDAEQAIAWTPVWSLTRQRTRWVPLAFGFAGTPTSGEERTCNWDSNGCATGNCLEEAVLQGLLELVERDAAAIYWYNRIPRPQVTPDTFDDPYFEQVQAHYRAMGHELWVLDITHDLGAWTFFAMAKERGGSRYAAGLGCHLDPRLALQRALSELHQVFDPARSSAPLWDGRDISDTHYLLPDPSQHRQSADYINHASADLAQDVAYLVESLRRRGLETLILDYSRPDIPLTAIKAIVPGLRHFWPRYAPGRLYDVAVEMGWRQCALDEATLNPLALQM